MIFTLIISYYICILSRKLALLISMTRPLNIFVRIAILQLLPVRSAPCILQPCVVESRIDTFRRRGCVQCPIQVPFNVVRPSQLWSSNAAVLKDTQMWRRIPFQHQWSPSFLGRCSDFVSPPPFSSPLQCHPILYFQTSHPMFHFVRASPNPFLPRLQ